MKAVLVCLSLFLCVKTSQAQPYQSIFGKTSTSWVFKWDNLPGREIDSFYVDKDTIINNTIYKEIVSEPGSPFGFIREDTNIGKVWYRNYKVSSSASDTVEKIAFRYDLVAGDTFNICNSNFNYSCPDSFYVVDSVRIKAGLKYIYFKAKIYGEPYTLIEGITSNMGVLLKHVGTAFMFNQYLLCSYKDGLKTNYENIRYAGNCHPPTAISEIEKGEISLSPNPAFDELLIRNNTSNSLIQAQIFDAAGRKLSSIEGSNITSINLKSFPGGYYFFYMLLSDHSYIIKPLIIQK